MAYSPLTRPLAPVYIFSKLARGFSEILVSLEPLSSPKVYSYAVFPNQLKIQKEFYL